MHWSVYELMVLFGAGIGEEVDEGEDNDAWKIWCASRMKKQARYCHHLTWCRGYHKSSYHFWIPA